MAGLIQNLLDVGGALCQAAWYAKALVVAPLRPALWGRGVDQMSPHWSRGNTARTAFRYREGATIFVYRAVATEKKTGVNTGKIATLNPKDVGARTIFHFANLIGSGAAVGKESKNPK